WRSAWTGARWPRWAISRVASRRRSVCSVTRSSRRKSWLRRRESTPHSVDGGRVEVPILKQGHYLIASIQSALTDADLSQLREALIERVGRFRARGVIVDVTALDVMDSFAVRTLRDIAHMARLRGAETVIVGIQPEVAFAMVQLGLTLKGVSTALDLEEGLAFLNMQTQVRIERGGPGRIDRG